MGHVFRRKTAGPRALETALEGRARVIEEGLNGRMIATDEPSRPHRDGLSMLPPLLESHAPLDVVIFMLGTNDSAPAYGLSTGKIAINAMALIRAVNAALCGPAGRTLKIVLVAPPPIGSLSPDMALLYSGGQTVSHGLAAADRIVAEKFGTGFFGCSRRGQSEYNRWRSLGRGRVADT